MDNFKKACKTTTIFLLIFALATTPLIQFFYHSGSLPYLDLPMRKEARGTLDTLFLGASQMERALNPEVIDEALGTTSYNMSSPSLSMKGKYELLKTEMKNNPVKTVCLEVSYNALGKGKKGYIAEGDLYLLGRLDNSFQRIRYFLTAVPVRKYGRVYTLLLKTGVECFRNYLEGTLKVENTRTLRGYLPYKKNEPTEKLLEDIRIKSDQHNRHQNVVIRDDAVYYMDKIIETCLENNIHIVMIATPLPEFTLNRFENFDEAMEPYRKEADKYGISFYDYSLWKEKPELLKDTEDYYDRVHLLPSGADKFSIQFSRMMQEEEQKVDLSGEFYKSYDERRKHIGIE